MKEKIDQYGTTIDGCGCMDYKYRQMRVGGVCKHMKWLREQKQKENQEVVIEDKSDAYEMEQKYGVDVIEIKKKMGEIYEKYGKLYILK